MTDNGKRFRVGLSFPGEHRDFISRVAARLAKTLGQEHTLYDRYHEAEFGRPNLDVYLPNLYRTDCELIAIFLCHEYAQKRWCRLEWRFVRQLIQTSDEDRILFLSFDNVGAIPALGILSGDGYVLIGKRSPSEIADLILQRLSMKRSPLSAANAEHPAADSRPPNQTLARSGKTRVASFSSRHWVRLCVIAGLLVAGLSLVVTIRSALTTVQEPRETRLDNDQTIRVPEGIIPEKEDVRPPAWVDEGAWICCGKLRWLKETAVHDYSGAVNFAYQTNDKLDMNKRRWRLPNRAELEALPGLVKAGALSQKPGDLIWSGDATQLAAWAVKYQPSGLGETRELPQSQRVNVRLVYSIEPCPIPTSSRP